MTDATIDLASAVEPDPGEWVRRFDNLPRDRRLATAEYLQAAAQTARTCFLENHRATIDMIDADVEEAAVLTERVGDLRDRLHALSTRCDELVARARDLEAARAQTAHDAAVRGYEEAVRLVGEHNPDLAAWLHALNPCEPFTPAERSDVDYFEQTGDDTL